MNQKYNNFKQIYTQAKILKENGNYPQARKKYLYLERNFNVNSVDYTDYIAMMGDLGDTERYLKLFQQSKSTFMRGLNYLNQANKFNRHVEPYEIEKQKYHLHSNLGLTLCAEAEHKNQKFEKYQTIKLLIDESLNNYRKCQKIVVYMIITKQKSQLQNFTWWKKQFIGWTINICNPLLVQANINYQKNVFSAILELVNRVQKFYDLCKKKTKEKLLSNLSQCYYYKALSLKFLGRIKQSEQYFLKDYNYCKENNEVQNLKKTKQQLRKFYLQLYDFRKARTYARKQDLDFISSQQKEDNQLRKKVMDIQIKIQRNLPLTQQQVEQVAYALNQSVYLKQRAFDFNKKLRSSTQFKTDKKIRYLAQYYAADNFFKFQKYAESQKYLKQALNLIENNLQQYLWCKFLGAKILQKTEKNRKKVQQSLRQSVQKSKQLNRPNEQNNLFTQCSDELAKFLTNEKIGIRIFQFDSSEYKKLTEYMVNERMKKQEIKTFSQMDQSQQILIQDHYSEDVQQEPQRKLVKNKNPWEIYQQNCKIYSIQPLQIFKNILNGQQDLKLEDFLFFPTKQIQLLIKSNLLIQDLDLRNFIMNLEFLKSIRHSQNIYGLKKFKVNLINAFTSQQKVKTQFFQQLQELIKIMPNLQHLHITNCYEAEKIQNIFKLKQISNLNSITVLKLKQCQLDDRSLMFLSLNDYLPQLKKLSLSRNCLQGNTLDCLTQLKNLQQLSLSQNSLTKMNLNKNFENLKSIKLNKLSNFISIQTASSFIRLFWRCEIINMKSCEQISINILEKFINCIIQSELQSLDTLKKINVFDSHLNQNTTVDVLTRFTRYCPNLTLIDIRNCKIKSTSEDQMIKRRLQDLSDNLNKHLRINNHYQSQSNSQNPQIANGFKMKNICFTTQNNKKLTSKFTVN